MGQFHYDGYRVRSNVERNPHKDHLLSEMIASHFLPLLWCLLPLSGDPVCTGLGLFLHDSRFAVKKNHFSDFDFFSLWL